MKKCARNALRFPSCNLNWRLVLSRRNNSTFIIPRLILFQRSIYNDTEVRKYFRKYESTCTFESTFVLSYSLLPEVRLFIMYSTLPSYESTSEGTKVRVALLLRFYLLRMYEGTVGPTRTTMYEIKYFRKYLRSKVSCQLISENSRQGLHTIVQYIVYLCTKIL